MALLVSRPAPLDAFRAHLAQDPEKIFVIADYDMTLTKAHVNGQKASTLMHLLRDSNVLPPAYTERENDIFMAYEQIIRKPDVTQAELEAASKDWFETKLALLVEFGLRKESIEDLVKSPLVAMRDGATDFFAALQKLRIPLIIVSASSLGVTAISSMLKHHGLLLENVHIISNGLVWDAEGKPTDYLRPAIHIYNKDELVLANYPEIERALAGRHHALLLGDRVGDLGIAKSFPHQSLLKVAFLNDAKDDGPAAMQEAFDMLVPDDGPLDPVTTLFT